MMGMDGLHMGKPPIFHMCLMSLWHIFIGSKNGTLKLENNILNNMNNHIDTTNKIV